MKYCNSKYRNRTSYAHLHDTLRIAALSMDPNITPIRPMQQKKQFHKSHSNMLPSKEYK